MTTDQALEEIEKHVQWCREEGETDLRGILYSIRSLREKCKKEAIEAGLLPDKDAKVPKYDLVTEGYDPDKLKNL